jgi:hypothetical protein
MSKALVGMSVSQADKANFFLRDVEHVEQFDSIQ